jgi:hypothetical protein
MQQHLAADMGAQRWDSSRGCHLPLDATPAVVAAAAAAVVLLRRESLQRAGDPSSLAALLSRGWYGAAILDVADTILPSPLLLGWFWSGASRCPPAVLHRHVSCSTAGTPGGRRSWSSPHGLGEIVHVE